MKNLLSLALLLSLFTFGCTAEAGTEEPTKKPEPAGSQSATVVHDVKCGCSIDGVGSCGNYILIDGRYVPLIHPSLGEMEFCKHKDAGARIETEGSITDGKFVAKHWKLVQ